MVAHATASADTEAIIPMPDLDPAAARRRNRASRGLLNLTALFSRAGRTAGKPRQTEGVLDSAENGRVRGWAYDRDHPDETLLVELSSASGVIATVPADTFREDLFRAGKGDGRHGFDVHVGWNWGLEGEISARIVSESRQLVNSPRPMTLSLALSGSPSQRPRTPLQEDNSEDEVRRAIAILYRLALGRTASDDELDIWTNQIESGQTLAGCVKLIAGSAEAEARRKQLLLLPQLSDGQFMQSAYEILLGRGISPAEIEAWQHRLRDEALSRSQIIGDFFAFAATRSISPPVETNDPTLTRLLGTETIISLEDWKSRRTSIARGEGQQKIGRPTAPSVFRIVKAEEIAVTMIASLYKGGEFIHHFLENIVSQTIFQADAELIIVDAASPEGESDVIARYQKSFSNIRHIRTPERIGIYDAWNIGVKEARGRFITNTNLDDVRSNESIQIQAATLESLPFVDVVYQDVYYSFEPNMAFDDIARCGFISDVPIITPYNLLAYNSPHNAPMWRKSLHDRVGMFDTRYRSAGDWDFWLRSAGAGAVFFKSNEPTVAYFVNPKGISTSSETLGIVEANAITKALARTLVSRNLTLTDAEFAAKLQQLAPADEAVAATRYGMCQQALRAVARTYSGPQGG